MTTGFLTESIGELPLPPDILIFPETPFSGAPVAVTTDDPLTAYKKVISSSGPLRLDANASSLRDELDTLLIESVVNQESILVAKDSPTTDDPDEPPSNGEYLLAQKYGISNSGFGTLSYSEAPTDSDSDGMPDYWENALGWNALSDDHNTLMANSGGYVTGTTFFRQTRRRDTRVWKNICTSWRFLTPALRWTVRWTWICIAIQKGLRTLRFSHFPASSTEPQRCSRMVTRFALPRPPALSVADALNLRSQMRITAPGRRRSPCCRQCIHSPGHPLRLQCHGGFQLSDQPDLGGSGE